MICKLRHATPQLAIGTFSLQRKNKECTLTLPIYRRWANINDHEMQTASSPWKMSHPKKIFEALDRATWLCSGGRRTSNTLSIFNKRLMMSKKFPHYNQEVSSVVKEELISPHSGKVQLQLLSSLGNRPLLNNPLSGFVQHLAQKCTLHIRLGKVYLE